MPLVLVLGSEGEGMRRLVAETCDLLVRIPMRGQIESLNVSVAGSIVLYEAWHARAQEVGAARWRRLASARRAHLTVVAIVVYSRSADLTAQLIAI